MKTRFLVTVAAVAALTTITQAQDSLLNASYDVSRELYKAINPAFSKQYKEQHGKDVEVKQSHGGSSKQARAVIEGLEADVVTFNTSSDINALVEAGKVSPEWKSKFPHNASPYTSISAFIVRKGNPKNIKDWDDLIRDDVKIALVNPKTGGNGRYTFLAAYGYALKKFGGDQEKAKQFLHKLYQNVPVLDTGGRAATTTFAQRGIGDVLITFEAEVKLIQEEFGTDKVEIVVPSVSVQAEFPVATVDPVTAKRGTAELAKAYLDYLFTEPAQEIIASLYYRPQSPEVAKKYADQFGQTELVNVKEVFGGSEKTKEFFVDGGLFDEIYTLNKR